MADTIFSLIVLVIIVILAIVVHIRKNRFIKEACGTTKGIIRDVEQITEKGGRRRRENFWIIEYRLGNTLFTLKQQAMYIRLYEMQTHKGD